MNDDTQNILLKIDSRLRMGESTEDLLRAAQSIIVNLDNQVAELQAAQEPQNLNITALQERLANIMAQVDNLRVNDGAFEQCKELAVSKQLKIPAEIHTTPELVQCILDQTQRKAGRKKQA
jgi:hypothetical protein